MSEKLKFSDGWRELSIEDRGLLFTLAAGSKQSDWVPDELSGVLGVDTTRSDLFIAAAVSVGVMSLSETGRLRLNECAGDAALRKSWERRFDEVFWPAVTTPWKKVGRANALKAWRTSVFGQIKPKTEEVADALLNEIMDGVDRYKQLLLQPNAPSMKYPEGWLSGQRWRDEIDDRFIEKHAAVQSPISLSPLERARLQQGERSRTIEMPSVVHGQLRQLPLVQPDSSSEHALPDFDVAL